MARKFAELRDKMPPETRAKAHKLAQAMLAQMEQAPRQQEGKGTSSKPKAETQPARVS